VALVTGANTGIGFETALQLAKWGARVMMACRDPVKGQAAVDRVNKGTGKKTAELVLLDLSDLANVAVLCETLKKEKVKLHLLVNNAGLMDSTLKKTKQNIESHFGTNHLAHFALTTELMSCLDEGARVVNVSSVMHATLHPVTPEGWPFALSEVLEAKEMNFNGTRMYSISKLCNILFTQELDRRYKSDKRGLSFYSVHPGVVHTEVARTSKWPGLYWLFAKLCAKTAHAGAQTTLYVAVEDKAKLQSGGYYQDCSECPLEFPESYKALSQTVWEASEKVMKEAAKQ